MKWLKIWFLVVLMLLISIGSYPQAMLKTSELNEDNSNVNIVDKIYKSKNNYLDINVVVPQINGISNKKQEDIVNDKVIKWTENWINEVKQIADEYFKDKPSPLMPYQLYARYKVTNNSDIISFYIDYYQFSGGAHGITNRIAYNIEKSSGNEMQLKDIFKDNYNYKDIINKEISRQISKDPDRYFTGKDGFNGIGDNQNFYIKNNKVVIYFGLYEIAPYAAGISEFIISNNLFEGNLKYGKI
ncbi:MULTISPECIES: DUF3298 and DUF4163 domain-containing protein [unclassified Clostridium]|uniref:DUF3298 and DUF4163 domain-containing protein n=1 Tax=unclassified Clostridium TaxID=2614128 RepID=UPI0018972A8D|nr:MULTISPECIES: DUF3298 and DUF4163 domain-containing protein [unclassified Clostridium]MBP3915628.1 DUF3298 and DUF4163 domain-containing protein [Clostridium sp.]MEE0931471.1 DUF3298 and DUF4163 domain-containing protein [Clostridium sp.]